MDSFLYLTIEEREKLFARLPEAIRKQWEPSVREERLDTYETTAELEKRIADKTVLQKHPEIKPYLDDLAKKLKAGVPPEEISLDDLPTSAIPVFLYNIGASGASAFIQMGLDSARTNEDMEGVAALSRARHRILQINAVLA